MNDRSKELFQKKKVIRFKVLMHFHHERENTMLNLIAKEADVNKSEVTKCVNTLVEEGLLEKDGYRTIRLTEIGYQIALMYLKERFDEKNG